MWNFNLSGSVRQARKQLVRPGAVLLLFLFTTGLFANGPRTEKDLALLFTSSTEESVLEPATGFVYTITVSGGSESTTLSLGNENDESYFDLNGDQLTFNTSIDYGSPYDEDQNNTYIAEIIVTDGEEEIRQLVTIAILNVIDVYFSGGISTSAADGRAYFETLKPEDEDSGEELTVLSAVLPEWLSLIEASFVTGSLDRELLLEGVDFSGLRAESTIFDNDGNVYWTSFRSHAVFKGTPEGEVSIFAGSSGSSGEDNGTGTDARFFEPAGITIDATGNLYVAEDRNNRIRKITPEGIVTTFAGQVGSYGTDDGSGTDARFSGPSDVLIDAVGNVYVADSDYGKIRKISPGGVVTTIGGVDRDRSGEGEESILREGPALAVTFDSPVNLAINSLGELFVADYRLATISKIDSEGMVTVITGPDDEDIADILSGDLSTYDLGLELNFSSEVSLAFNSEDVLYVKADSDELYTVDAEGNVTRVALSDTSPLGSTSEILFDENDDVFNIYRNNRTSHRLNKLDFSSISVLAGTPNGDVGENEVTLTVGNAAGQTADYTFTINVDDQTQPEADFSTTASFVENSTDAVLTLTATDNNPNAELTFKFLAQAAAECDEEAGDNCYNYPERDEDDPEFFDDSRFFEIRDNQLFFLEAPDAENPLDNNSNNTYVLAFELSDGRNQTRVTMEVIVTDEDEHAPVFASEPITTVTREEQYAYNVRVVDADLGAAAAGVTGLLIPEWLTLETNDGGVATPIAGNGQHGSNEGSGTNAAFNGPTSAALDAEGNLYVTDAFQHSIRKVDANGIVTTLAGSGSRGSADGTGSGASFYLPLDLVIGDDGNIYVADSDNGLIRRVTTDGVVTTFAGGGGDDEGTGTSASIPSPNAITVDSDGNLYVVIGNRRIKKITPEGVVTNVAGSSSTGYQDGTGTDASFRHLDDISVDNEGNLYVTDLENINIRKVTPEGVVSTFWSGLDTNDLERLERYLLYRRYEDFRGNSSFYDGYEYGRVQDENEYYASLPYFRPRGITTGSDGKIYVSGLYKSSILIFNSQGIVTGSLGEELAPEPSDGPEEDPKDPKGDPREPVEKPFRPRGLVVDEVNNVLYVTDMGGATVQTVSLDGAVLKGDPAYTPDTESMVALQISQEGGIGAQQEFTITIEGDALIAGPELIESFPADDSEDFNSNTLTFTFDSNVEKGSGVIEVVDDIENGKVFFQIGVRHPSVTIVDNVVSVKMPYTLPNGFNFYTRISEGAFINEAGGSFDGIDNKSDLNFATASAPVIVASTPENGGEDFSGKTLTFTFDTNVTKGAGSIEVVPFVDDFGGEGEGEPTFQIGVRHPSITINENVVSVVMSDELPIESTFSIKISDGAFVNDAGLGFKGISDPADFVFSTPSAPYMVGNNLQNSRNGFSGRELIFYFNSEVRKGTGAIEVIPVEGDGSPVFSVGVRHPSVNVSEGGVSVTMSDDLPLGTEFYIKMSPGAFIGTADINFQGITDERELIFMTVSPPSIVSSTPENGSEGFLDTYFSFTFSEDIVKGSGTISLVGEGVDPFIVGVNHPNVTVSGSRVTVNVGSRLAFNTSYSLVLPEGAFIGSVDEPKKDEPKKGDPRKGDPEPSEPKSIGLKSSAVLAGQITFSTGGPAQLVSSNPENEGTLSGKTITLDFDKAMTKGSGSISVLDVSDNSVLFTTGVNHPRVIIKNSSVIIEMPNALPKDKSVSLNMSATALKGDTDGLSYEPSLAEGGVVLFFSTESSLKPVSFTPENDNPFATDGNQVASLTVVFNKTVSKGAGVITVFDASDDSEVFKIGVNHPRVSVDEDGMSINLRRKELPASRSYYVQMSSGVVTSGSEAYVGIADKTTWNFGTFVDTPSVPVQVDVTQENLTKNESSQLEINVYPNPASKEITIDLTGLGNKPALRLMRVDGTVMLSKSDITSTTVKVDVSNYTTGVYLVLVQSQDGRLTRKKFIVSK